MDNKTASNILRTALEGILEVAADISRDDHCCIFCGARDTENKPHDEDCIIPLTREALDKDAQSIHCASFNAGLREKLCSEESNG